MKFFTDNTATAVQQNVATLPRYRTIRECVAELKKLDEGTAISEYFVRRLCQQNLIRYFSSGNKALVSFDDLLRYLEFSKNNTQTKNQKYNLGD